MKKIHADGLLWTARSRTTAAHPEILFFLIRAFANEHVQHVPTTSRRARGLRPSNVFVAFVRPINLEPCAIKK